MATAMARLSLSRSHNPREVRDRLMAEEGDMLTLLQINDLMLLTRRQPRVPALTEHFTAESEQKDS
jgi:hypothetical protein